MKSYQSASSRRRKEESKEDASIDRDKKLTATKNQKRKDERKWQMSRGSTLT